MKLKPIPDELQLKFTHRILFELDAFKKEHNLMWEDMVGSALMIPTTVIMNAFTYSNGQPLDSEGAARATLQFMQQIVEQGQTKRHSIILPPRFKQ